MLLRHAKSDWPSGVADPDRPLAPRGRRDAPRMGQEMARRGYRPDLAIVSPARRAVETWALAGPFLPDTPLRYEQAIYAAEPETILAVLSELDENLGTVLVVGHNPGLELTASFLTGEGPHKLRDRLGEKFPTAALAVVAFASQGWSHLAQGSGRLEVFVTPHDLA